MNIKVEPWKGSIERVGINQDVFDNGIPTF